MISYSGYLIKITDSNIKLFREQIINSLPLKPHQQLLKEKPISNEELYFYILDNFEEISESGDYCNPRVRLDEDTEVDLFRAGDGIDGIDEGLYLWAEIEELYELTPKKIHVQFKLMGVEPEFNNWCEHTF